jgi:protein TonB
VGGGAGTSAPRRRGPVRPDGAAADVEPELPTPRPTVAVLAAAAPATHTERRPEPRDDPKPEAHKADPPKAEPSTKPTPRTPVDDGLPAWPQPLSRPQPVFPATALEGRDQPVTVTVTLHVAASGEVAEVVVSDPSGVPAVDAAARDACRRWRFSAARQGKRFAQTFKVRPH